MPIQAFFDESGGKNAGPHFVMAGLISTSEKWRQFSTEWEVRIKAPPGLVPFKMSKIMQWKNETLRDEKLIQLAGIINRHAEGTIFAALSLEDHAQSWGKLAKPFSDPYFWPFFSVIFGVCKDLWIDGLRESFELIFDEHVIFGPRVKLWYPVIRDVMHKLYGEEYSILPDEVLFKRDDEFLPLQACDLYAGCHRRSNFPGADSMDWLSPYLSSVKRSPHSVYFLKEGMDSTMNQPSAIFQEKKDLFTEEVIAGYKKLVER